MKRKSIIWLFFGVVACSPVSAQLVMQAEIRPRGEVRLGYQQLPELDDHAAYFISQRTRLTLNYTHKILSLGFSIQDVRIWGDETIYTSTGIVGDNGTFDLNEAWIGLQIYPSGFLKIGRQYWLYEDERIFSVRNWNQYQVKYDAVLLQHKTDRFRLDVGLSYNASAESVAGNPYPDDKMRTINFIYFQKPVNNWMNFSLSAIATGFMRDDTSEVMFIQGTYAGYLNVKREKFTGIASLFYQNGNSRYKTTSSAYMFSVKGDYKFGKFSLGGGLDYISGQDDSRTDAGYQEKDHFFDILYGVRHRYYGHMDLFNNMRKVTAQGGLVNPFINLKYNINKKTSVYADIHHFWLQATIEDPTAEEPGNYLEKALGPEFDLGVNWSINEFINLKGGYSMFFPTETMNILESNERGNDMPGAWTWLMLTVNPVLLDTGKKKE
jgi:hypothetical protein